MSIKRPVPSGIAVIDAIELPRGDAYRDPPSRRGFTVVRRWLAPELVLMTVFCCLWDAFLVVWCVLASRGNPSAMLVAVPHTVVGLGMTYSMVCGWVNRTEITADGERLRVVHAPLPWFGRREIAISAVRQLFCEATVRRRRTDYSVSALLTDGTQVRLLSNLQVPDQARFIELAIEDRLGIADEPVGVADEMRSLELLDCRP